MRFVNCEILIQRISKIEDPPSLKSFGAASDDEDDDEHENTRNPSESP